VPVVREVFNFYFEGSADRFAVYPTETLSDEQVRRVIEERAGNADRLWFVDARLWGADPERRIPEYLAGAHRLADRKVFPCAEVSLFLVADGRAPEARPSSPPS
jgi:hypothetical protein